MLRFRLYSEYSRRTAVVGTIILIILALSMVTELVQRRFASPVMQGDVLVDAGELVTWAIQALIITLPATIRNVLPALLAILIISFVAARFVHKLYGTKTLREATELLSRNIFGMDSLRPIMIVREGKIDVGAGSLADRVGGRCFLLVYNDSAVTTEKAGRLYRVIGGPFIGFLDRFERIYEIVDLRNQRWPFTVSAMTKEGIPVSCQADITFKIDDRYLDRRGNVQVKRPVEAPSARAVEAVLEGEIAKGISKPLPYTEQAVFNACTGNWIRIRQIEHDEQMRKWTGRVILGEVEGALRSILADYRLDWLISPPQSGQEFPREEIRRRLEEKLEQSLAVGNKTGARLLNVSLGEIKVDDEVAEQWIKAWQAGWERRAVTTRAEGEAELIWLEAAQVRAQAETVLALAEAIRPLVSSGEELSSYQLAVRFVEMLRWMSYDPFTRAFLPPEAMRTLQELEELLNKEPLPPEFLGGSGRRRR